MPSTSSIKLQRIVITSWITDQFQFPKNLSCSLCNYKTFSCDPWYTGRPSKGVWGIVWSIDSTSKIGPFFEARKIQASHAFLRNFLVNKTNFLPDQRWVIFFNRTIRAFPIGTSIIINTLALEQKTKAKEIRRRCNVLRRHLIHTIQLPDLKKKAPK